MTWVLYNPNIADDYNLRLWHPDRRAPNDQNLGYSILSIDSLFDVGWVIVGTLE